MTKLVSRNANSISSPKSSSIFCTVICHETDLDDSKDKAAIMLGQVLTIQSTVDALDYQVCRCTVVN